MSKIALLVTFLLSASIANALTIGLLGDAGKKNESTQQVLRSMLQAEIKNVALLGDNLYDLNLSYKDVWEDWFTQGIQFPVVAIGNHNISYQAERDYFHMPDEFYSKTIEDVRFIVLNSDNQNNVLVQRDFFMKEMAQARKLKNTPGAPTFTFVIFHHPPATLSARHNWTEKKAFHDALRPLLLEYRDVIDGIFVGHDHMAAFYRFADLPLVVSGAAFEFFPANQVQSDVVPGVAIKSLWTYKPKAHWARLETFPDKHEAYVHFISIDGKDGKDSKVVCSVLLKSRQIALQANCQQ